jgi:hypothetical protein
MKDFVLDFISQLEGYKTKIKELHWEDKSLPGHELAGDIEKMICDFEDSVAEDLQGVFGEDIKVNTLHPYSVKSATLKEFVDSLKNSAMLFYKKLDGDDYIGARSEVEGFIHNINVKKYLVNKTSNKLNEHMKQEISENKLVDMITESLMPEFSDDNSNANDLKQEAMRIWVENDLESDIDWEESDWVTSGDETYGPCNGFVECDGWEFNVPGDQDGYEQYEVNYDEPVEFTSPDGETGEFYLKEIQNEPVKLTKDELNEVINMAKEMVLNAKKK